MVALLIAEHADTVLSNATAKALTAAKALGGEVDILVAGKGCGAAAEEAAKLEGVRKVLLAEADHLGKQIAEEMAALVLSLADGYSALLAPATSSGKNFLPRVAALLDVPQISEIVAVE